MDAVTQALTLLDWKRRVFALYAEVRAAPDPAVAWRLWRETRDELFRGHPHPPLPEPDGDRVRGLAYSDHDPALDVEAELRAVEPEPVSLPASAGDGMAFRTVAPRPVRARRGRARARGLLARGLRRRALRPVPGRDERARDLRRRALPARHGQGR